MTLRRKQQLLYLIADLISSELVWLCFLIFRWMVNDGHVDYMRDALKQFDGRNQVRISAVSATTPIVLSDGLGATALLMPVQVSKKEESKAA